MESMVQPDGRRALPEWRNSETRSRAAHAVDLQNASVHHPGRPVLQHLDFYVREGDVLGIIGPAGGGNGSARNPAYLLAPSGNGPVYGSLPCARLRRQL